MKKRFVAYPITVKPIFKEQVWGGRNLEKYMKLPAGKKVGEAWFMADQEGNDSFISNGVYKGMSIDDYVKVYPRQVLGAAVASKYGGRFPLLFKFIDAKDKLSVQVHPDDKLAKAKMGGDGKTELWYILETKTKSKVHVGLKRKISGKQIVKMASDGSIARVLKSFTAKEGECYFVPAGTVHAVGEGNLIYEIQQNSDITFRLYDWDRMNLGVRREIHAGWGAMAMKYSEKAGKCAPLSSMRKNGMRVKTAAQCPYFTVSEVLVEKHSEYRYNDAAAAVYAVVSGRMTVFVDGRTKFDFSKGSVVLFPAAMNKAVIKFQKGSKIIATEIK